MDGTTRLLRNAALSDLVADVRSRRAHLELSDPDRQFYLGVEAAAEETLHPELASTRHAAWLERQTVGFRDGYQRTLANIATASTLADPPVRILVPEPQHQ